MRHKLKPCLIDFEQADWPRVPDYLLREAEAEAADWPRVHEELLREVGTHLLLPRAFLHPLGLVRDLVRQAADWPRLQNDLVRETGLLLAGPPALPLALVWYMPREAGWYLLLAGPPAFPLALVRDLPPPQPASRLPFS